MHGNHVHEGNPCPCKYTGKVTQSANGVLKTGSLTLRQEQQRFGKPLPPGKLAQNIGGKE